MRNDDIFNESKLYMPGGVNSPVRAFKDVAMNPPVIKKGSGSHIYDEDGNEYIDFVCSWGPMILGHCDPDVVEAIKSTSEKAISFGATTEPELELAKYICSTVDNVEMLRMVNSGTEATMSAVRLARGYTGRNKIIKFAGCYHGHFDDFLVEAGSGVMTEGIPGSAGVPDDSIKNTLVAQYNDISSVESIFEKHGSDIAAVIVEPVAGNMGVIPGDEDFLKGLRRLCDENGSLLIFDEVMSGFRVAYKGAQSIYKIKPDLTTMAKIIGGGLPCGAYGGRKDIMEKLSPLGPVYQAGTMSGNPIVVAAGLATLKKLHDYPQYYVQIEKLGQKLVDGIRKIAQKKNLPVVMNRCGAMFALFFTEASEVKNYSDAKKCRQDIFAKYFEHMISRGIYIAPSQFEAVFLSVKHTEEDIDRFLEAFDSFEI
ncbi:MAG: glutamate-1-semialdehyde 2,1-aminomutase [Clostridium luticellarii]|jgi:glutamate-1-semialdehyde 2,1-aminomutase|uniref:glutamate-1-semialdehyde 2,1-aminomutase n=1 Tax=Clostridium luticellarii TaxID=1691940 RepID=UPI002352FFC6|nr:glutamate-1-semialdehyde 2,1-aminomutase [Clostridium luticellarii]MCI1945637.1 glutamate-1-semialdehyde 2,1-aminomutase [Clostridium luticellarii]MCI1996529.1 glutamate-1-semialdehyde 2,1-aminomutase [Clostridium luticellarii]MCI2039848.1 glutamate-1-semialdehyde 2,1-aminomutase [Clostridium luticellarii]